MPYQVSRGPCPQKSLPKHLRKGFFALPEKPGRPSRLTVSGLGRKRQNRRKPLLPLVRVRMSHGIPAGRGQGESVGNHRPAVGAVAVVVNGISAVAHRTQKLVAACAHNSSGEKILPAPVADIRILVVCHKPSFARFASCPDTRGQPGKRNAGTKLSDEPPAGTKARSLRAATDDAADPFRKPLQYG